MTYCYVCPVLFSWLLFARCLIGAGVGIGVPTTNMYLSEISLIRFRGMLSTLNILNAAIFVSGSLFLAAILPFDLLIKVAALPACLFLIIGTLFLPESPIWFAKKNQIDNARKSLEWLRGSKYDLQEELVEMEHILANKQDLKENFEEMRQRKIFLPILMMIVIMSLQVFF